MRGGGEDKEQREYKRERDISKREGICKGIE